MSDWQPIETAPKDGKRVILFAGGHICTGGYDPHWTGKLWVYDQRRVNPGTVPSHWLPLPHPPPRGRAMSDDPVWIDPDSREYRATHPVPHNWVRYVRHDAVTARDDEIARLRAEVERLTDERYRLAYAICGGEDFAGILDDTSVEALVKIARDAAVLHMETIDRAMRAEDALADERAHADALADTLYSMDGLQKIDCEMRDSAIAQHRARRQG